MQLPIMLVPSLVAAKSIADHSYPLSLLQLDLWYDSIPLRRLRLANVPIPASVRWFLQKASPLQIPQQKESSVPAKIITGASEKKHRL